MQRNGACSNITDANFIAILQQGIGYQVFRGTGAMARARRSTSGSIPKSRYFVHIFGFALATHACVSPIAPNLRPSFFLFLFHTPTPTSCLQLLLLLAGAACQVLAFLYGSKAASRPCGPCQSSICAATHATSNIKLISPTASWEPEGGSPSPSTWHHHSLRLCHAVSLSAPTSYPISASIATLKVWLPVALPILLALGSGSDSN